ncbi:Iron complex outer membrane receptor protein [Ignavibacterium album JCM 16511]|uniref:Iron complex outer membrane receptor protein n=1 Tax=Ignavibacterium album (strain DSM 19864 / JCM 16511 / NBRC 101810 / Mat9-16) TaxID=945713 RepID=I0ALK9_IGNAJ|nr:TonB-dependent receptor [Ignavibacterium album]AFH49866.1 Iron complex outer membrane receptor protein [Ignavibacterium album JCM 16511]
MRKLLFIVIIIFSRVGFSQTFEITGRVTDPEFTPISGVNVYLVNTTFGDATNEKGFFQIKNIPSGNYELEISAIGYSKKRQKITIEKDIKIDFILIPEAIKTDEIIVTAGKYEQKKSELPVSTEIIYGTKLIERNFRNLEAAMRFVPGVNMTEDQISIRGSSGYSRGAGARALLTIDGLPFYTGDTGEIVWEMIPTTEIQRVEIIKGAASSLYGSSAIGGVVSAITRDISSYPRTMFNAYYGFYDKPYYKEWDWSGLLRPFNGVTISHSNTFDNFGFNISLTRLEDLSYRRDDFSKKYIGFLKLKYEFTPKSSLLFLVNSFNKRAGNFLYWKDSRNALVNSDFVSANRIETNRYLLGLVYKNLRSDQTVLFFKGNYYRNNFTDNSSPSNISTSDLYRLETQITSSLNKHLILTSGVELVPSKVNSSLFGNPSAISAGLYSVADINFDFPLIVSVGLRYDYGKLDSLKASGSISPKVGLNYKLLENLIFRSSLGTGFRNPTLAEAFTSTSTSGITVKPNPKIKPERNLTIELGVTYSYQSLFEIDFALFQNEYYKMIEASVDPSDGLIFFNNLLRARIQGFEIGSTINIIPGILKSNLAYTYLYSRDIERGTSLKYRPKHSFTGSAEFTNWHFGLGIFFRYQSRVDEIDNELIDLGIVRDGNLRVPVYQTDVNMSYDLISFGLPASIYVNIKNIFNYNYVELVGNFKPIRNFSFGFNLIL